MAFLPLNESAKESGGKTKIMIFAEGTILKPKSIFFQFNHKAYVPTGESVARIRGWSRQGAEILYCTSRRGEQAGDIAALLMAYQLKGTRLYFREKGQQYHALVEDIMPDVLIEDDCRSIGGKWQMCISYVEPHKKARIQSIVVPEFRGIDHLPSDLEELRKFQQF